MVPQLAKQNKIEGCNMSLWVGHEKRHVTVAGVISRRNFTKSAAAIGIASACSRNAGAAIPSPDNVPQGAAALGYNKKIIDLIPTTQDIAPGRTGNYALFEGMFYDPTPPDKSPFSMENGVLKLPLGKSVATQSRISTQGTLPYLNGSTGFYVEFDVRLSNNHRDHWPAVWVMPQEHNIRGDDHEAGDPPGYERWMELDVDEGGFGPGTLSSVLDWQGMFDHRDGQYWRDYPANRIRGNVVTNFAAKDYLDRTKRHSFGASYHPGSRAIQWYLDDTLIFKASAPAVASQHQYYMIAGAQSHGAKVPYDMFLHRIRAYSVL
jgi:hypothetical protein